MEPIFDRDGRVVGWIHPDSAIVDLNGNNRTVISNEAIFDYRPPYLGRLYAGYIWE